MQLQQILVNGRGVSLRTFRDFFLLQLSLTPSWTSLCLFSIYSSAIIICIIALSSEFRQLALLLLRFWSSKPDCAFHPQRWSQCCWIPPYFEGANDARVFILQFGRISCLQQTPTSPNLFPNILSCLLCAVSLQHLSNITLSSSIAPPLPLVTTIFCSRALLLPRIFFGPTISLTLIMNPGFYWGTCNGYQYDTSSFFRWLCATRTCYHYHGLAYFWYILPAPFANGSRHYKSISMSLCS